MTAIALNEPVKAILLDIEGTTTPIDFVTQVLFPYAREHVSDYLADHDDQDLAIDLMVLRAEREADIAEGRYLPSFHEADAPLEFTVAYIHWLMDRDRKSTPLKSLQGRIWEEGYRTGELKGDIYTDVPRALERWRRQNRRICIYSSGSVLAQQLLFAHTSAGDLTGLIDGYFDTRTGAKRDAESYRRIAGSLQIEPAEMVFVSDVTAELEAAHSAGAQILLAARPGNAAQPQSHLYPQVPTFDAIFP